MPSTGLRGARAALPGRDSMLMTPPPAPPSGPPPAPPPAPPPFVELALKADERTQIEEQLAASFGLIREAARTWVETTARRGSCFGRVTAGGVIAASFAAETLALVRGDERLTAVMLQSCYVHPDYRGRGYGLERADVEDLRCRFAADAVILTLFDEGLVPYWRRRGFEIVQRAGVIDLGEYLRRAGSAFSPALEQEAIVAKLAENAADGAVVTELPAAGPGEACAADGMLLVRSPGDEVVEELIVRAGSHASGSTGNAVRAAVRSSVRVRLKTVMASPGDLDLVCPINL